MKINRFVVTILLMLGMILTSCKEEEEKSFLYYKSYFLGTEFSLDGQIYGPKGQNLSASALGKNITAKIYPLGEAWVTKSSLDGNKFSFQISSTNSDGVALSKDLAEYPSTLYNLFISYFQHKSIPYDGPEGSTQIYGLSFTLDDGSDLKEYESSKDFNYDEHFDYIYVTEPVNMSGSFDWQSMAIRHYEYYDCNFSQPGWYKLVLFFDHAIGNNPRYASTKDRKLRTYE
jgi:hypothetical protein